MTVFNHLVEKEEDMDEAQLSRVFAALGDPTRRDMVARLARGDATLTELATSYDVSVQAVSKHLKVLEDAGLVQRSKDAQRRPCHLDAEVLGQMTGWIERRRQEVEERYQRLDAPLDKMAPPTTRRAVRTTRREDKDHDQHAPVTASSGRTPTPSW
jgi:DNA-binding transcriptional ArsR family regulator